MPQLTIQEAIRRTARGPYRPKKNPSFDWETGEFATNQTGKLSLDDDITALKTWIRKTLCTDRGMYPIYNFDHGSDFYQVIGYDDSYVNARVGGIISEALMMDQRIASVVVNDVEIIDNALIIDITVKTTIDNSSFQQTVPIQG